MPTRVLVVLVLLGFALPALAEDPPAPDAPPAAETPPAPEAAPEPPPTAEPPSAPAPVAAPGVRPPSSWQPQEDGPPPPAFPPRAAPDLREPPTPSPEPVDPFADEPGVRPGLDAMDQPSGMVGGALALPTEPPTRTEVVGIRKTHNVVWRCACADTLALRLDILFAVVGMKGEWVGATVDFYNEAGRPLLSVTEPFMNRAGQVSAWTKLIRIKQDARWLRTTVVIPYRAFPCPADRGSYRVEARVRLVKRRDVDQYQTVARGTTTFTVHGTSNAPKDWRDYTGAAPRKLPSCAERVQRYMGRDNPLKVAEEAPGRARSKWRPFCPVPGA